MTLASHDRKGEKPSVEKLFLFIFLNIIKNKILNNISLHSRRAYNFHSETPFDVQHLNEPHVYPIF